MTRLRPVSTRSRRGAGPDREGTPQLAPTSEVELRRAAFILALVIGGVATGGEPPPPAPGSIESRYAGTYVYVGDGVERVEIKAAVDRATEHMFGKVIAREELMKRAEIRPSYTIQLDLPGQVSVETPGFPREVSPLDGTEVELRTKYGDLVRSSHRFEDGALVQRARTEDGSGSTEFRLDPDGNTLRVTRISRSPKLPGVVEYTLTYRRR